ncbi:MAG: hypothetical protein EU539_13795 [Promethearchaeota archaeon]|nr:MAG: hypothetical protein EU539_13795 [Candidatus Lokiarchaeota archaeon]
MAMKGILWSIVFFITALIYFVISTYLIFTHWVWLNELRDFEGNPIYTFALLSIFLYAVSLLVGLIYAVAMVRAVVQRNNEKGLGIPKGVKGFGLASDLIVIALFITWYLLFNEIAIFTLQPPY